MISMAIIFAVSAVFIAGLAVFWKNILEWIKKAAKRISEVLGITVDGTRTFVTKTKDGIKNVSKYYSQNKLTGEWQENILTKPVSESEIPKEILYKVRSAKMDQEVSTTEELRLVLSN